MSAPSTALIGPAPAICVDHVGEGPPLLFLHGVGGNRQNWHGQLLHFADRFTALSWDARGYGLSEDYDGPLLMPDLVADIDRVLDHFRAPKVHLVGLSMGALIALNYAFSQKERVASLVLANTSAALDHDPVRAAEFLRLRLKPLQDGRRPSEIAEGIVSALVAPSANEVAKKALNDSIAGLRPASYIKALTMVSQCRIDGDLATLTIPTLYVTGSHDRVTPPSVAQEAAGRIPGCRLITIQNAGHLTNIEQPAQFNDALDAFFQSAFG